MEQSTVSGPPFGTKDYDDHHVFLFKGSSILPGKLFYIPFCWVA